MGRRDVDGFARPVDLHLAVNGEFALAGFEDEPLGRVGMEVLDDVTPWILFPAISDQFPIRLEASLFELDPLTRRLVVRLSVTGYRSIPLLVGLLPL